ncbi:MAG: beta-propeller domain-containing protein [Bacillota bacterium]
MKIRIAVGIAFALCAAIVAVMIADNSLERRSVEKSDGITVFESYYQIEKALGEILEKDQAIYSVEEETETFGVTPPTSGSAVVDAEASDKGEDYSETYVQVDGVDESDIIKTDGKYIYYASRLGSDVVVAKVSDGRAEEVAVIDGNETGISPDNLFLAGDRLLIIGNEYEEEGTTNYYVTAFSVNTKACIYDVSDPEKPEPVGEYRQSGFCSSARVADGYLYLVSNDYLDRGEKRIVPFAGTGEDFEKLAPNCVCAFPDPRECAYAVIGSVKIDSADVSESETRAILGSSGNIYCNGSSIYLTDGSTVFTRGDFDSRTHIVKAEIDKGRIAFAEEGTVRGSVASQFAMDEKDGYFRIATTAWVNGRQVNYLYVLNDKLDQVGRVRGFAAGEEIKAVRYIGDTAYVITYMQTDPLFVIDLSDPENPKKLGSVKITGFSSLLVPEEGNRLLGIGTSTSQAEFGEVEDGLKLVLFDVSDPEDPKVLDSRTYKGYYSEVEFTHKALVVNRSEGWYAVPYSNWDDENGGVLQFRVKDGALEEVSDYKGDEELDRCLYIDDYFYGLETYDDEIISWKIAQ